ncbi:molybdate ABC transporter permease subunit [Chitinophaga sancti]|uniref:Molybdenum transport system permease n=1 Tax=Chitinophaga sancti TaxID=1004 RepID=A0A1K1R9X4_9BACT|nr:molybdate ABC transporter permease subunit [Chitinophaga sancti]WQD65515.1 molybdate ABC transporter permease subunit [Chitinophaga sancti]WQG88862.1 molybdate ABC transporter permease subunit [Chitinophaga sancti]SFW68845.1 molybdate transport system permease protein [Chitinophaga sancti]
MIETAPILLTLQLALFTTVILFFIAVPIAWWLSQKPSPFKTVMEVLVSMPLVLPPSVIGFYLLMAFRPEAFLAKYMHIRLAFSFEGLLIGSLLYSLPFMVHPIQSGLTSLPESLKEAAYSLGKSKWQTLVKVLLPNIKPSLLTGIILTFAHTVGEFGIVLMVGGNIPGKTRTAAIAIYDENDLFHYDIANKYALVLIGVSFVVLFSMYFINRRIQRTNYF